MGNPAVLDVTIREPERIARHFERPPWQGWGARTAKWLDKNADLWKAPDAGQEEDQDAQATE
ncbi:hypothetical protein Pan97_12690 [Bremerella volcania]|uniref:Uncharacterized protein n=1 Tax=Bremerella volcania TaxID=2527984 RepID=A0A518C4V3_9BACT|nr:hypothetical protein [Bremerella volcania]QDU74262.1 hypothetical protein Pan97_12690 [Bremerella volcania]